MPRNYKGFVLYSYGPLLPFWAAFAISLDILYISGHSDFRWQFQRRMPLYRLDERDSRNIAGLDEKHVAHSIKSILKVSVALFNLAIFQEKIRGSLELDRQYALMARLYKRHNLRKVKCQANIIMRNDREVILRL